MARAEKVTSNMKPGMLASPELATLPVFWEEDDSVALEVAFNFKDAVAVETVVVLEAKVGLEVAVVVVVADALGEPV